MRKLSGMAMTLVVLSAAGFAAASIASGASLFGVLTGTTETSPEQWATTGTTPWIPGRRVTICHHTHSLKHPGVTITVSQHSLNAHLRRGDTLGPCSNGQAPPPGHHGKGSGRNGGGGGGDGTPTVTTSASPDGNSGSHGHDHGHGHGSEHGKSGK
jgi:hypothetical protein